MSMKGRRRRALIAALAVIIMTPAVSVGATEGSYSGGRTSYNDTSGSAGGGTIFDRVSGGGSSPGDTGGAVEVYPVTVPEGDLSSPEPTGTPASLRTMEPEAVQKTPEARPTASPSESPEAAETPGRSPKGTGEAEKTPENSAEGTKAAQEMPSEIPGTKGAGEEVRPTPSRNPDRNKVKGRESTVKGVYLATAVDGCAVITDVEVVIENYGLNTGEELHAKFSNLNGAEYPVAKRLLDMAAESQEAEVAASLSIEFGKMEGTKYSLLPSDGEEIQILVGLPAEAAGERWTYAVVAVRRNGSVYILEDLDQDPDTVTFTTTGGAGAYALIRY